MAKVRIETEDNEYGLVDYALYVNDEFVVGADNFTTEENALSDARIYVGFYVKPGGGV